MSAQKPIELDPLSRATILHRLAAVEGELASIKALLHPGWWACKQCGLSRAPDWFSYRVKEKMEFQWTEPACAMCARKMISEGPIKRD